MRKGASSSPRGTATGRAALVFCNSRKNTGLAAAALTKQLGGALLQAGGAARRQRLHEVSARLRDPKLREYVQCGVGFHTAGLEAADRTDVEQLFCEGALPVLCTTSGLAQGVNLPAHLVVLMNTSKYSPQLQQFEEYNMIEVLQMAGRAGRPQFDTSGKVVVMTRPDVEQRYSTLIGGTETIESHMHTQLLQHLNAEIASGGHMNDLAVTLARLQPYVLEAATPCAGGTRPCLQPRCASPGSSRPTCGRA